MVFGACSIKNAAPLFSSGKITRFKTAISEVGGGPDVLEKALKKQFFIGSNHQISIADKQRVKRWVSNLNLDLECSFPDFRMPIYFSSYLLEK